ncbi:hypothetical protein Bhyg_01765 [Pseudolycoriella hygida]|uniref:Steroid 5-alpha reductase C-terminal domain-containing protein n=1 Tax=Pseudolycoriella hygida TaxID=35572 RepID=A0A9Q0S5W4_9DIPT|nr:hypothetical protein Bhyg_01765 [Pseudolycoriella hygida]
MLVERKRWKERLIDELHFQTNSAPVDLVDLIENWILSMVTGLHAWVDKWWSINPAIYALHFIAHDYASSKSPDIRLWITTILICVWAARLSWNFHRKGGYGLTFVDYRWPFVQTLVSPAVFFIFNIVFIALYQNILLVLITSPLYVIQQASHMAEMPLNWIDAVATIGLIGCIVLETVADNQQWAFYAEREKKAKLTGDVKRGFLSQGLFRYSRHPNFFGEMGIWWFVYLFSVGVTYPVHIQLINPTIIGTINLTLLFQGSTPLTEYLSSSKYPAYKNYQKTTSRLIPLPPGRPLDDFEEKNE